MRQILLVLLVAYVSYDAHAEQTIHLTDLLNEQGKIVNPNQLSGTIDFSGFIPIIDDCEGLKFVVAPPVPGWNALGIGLNDGVLCITISGTDIYVGGSFTDAGGNPDADRVAKWDGNTWQALGVGLNGAVYAIQVSGTDIYVGGQFAAAGGNPDATYIAKWDGFSWNGLGTGLTGGAVNTIAISGSDVYAGGLFTNAGGNPNADYVARWDGSGWNALGISLNAGVNEILISGVDVYVGGGFTNANSNANADYIVRWNGVTWSALGTGLNSFVSDICLHGTSICVGGNFTDAGGNINADRIALWNGVSWSALGLGLSARVNRVASNGSIIYAGGFFTNAGGNPNADYVAVWDGSGWGSLGTGVNLTVYPVTISGGDVYVGGYFTAAGGNPNANRIARWETTPLDVELLGLYALINNNTTHLTWRTASQINNQGFAIQRSVNSHDWQDIGWVAGHGTTTQEQEYHFIDEAPLAGKNYYRLAQLDFDGQVHHSEIVSTDHKNGGRLYTSPNPVRDLLTISLPNDEEAFAIELYNSLGQVVWSEKRAMGRIDIPVASWPKGLYRLVCGTEQQQILIH